MKPIEPPDSTHLEAAHGWLELGNHLEADKELERITPQLRSHPDVLEVRWQINVHAKKWDACKDIAAALCKLKPDSADAWNCLSFSCYKLGRTQEAYDLLAPIADKALNDWRIPYNLACYCAQLGRLKECQEWFKKAMRINESAVKKVALADPDLKPLWNSIGGTRWKRTEQAT